MHTHTLTHMHIHRLRPIAVNAYVFILVINPASINGMIFSDIILQMWEGMFPLRMGE